MNEDTKDYGEGYTRHDHDTKDCARLPVADVSAMARALCNYHADLCGVNRDDQWNLYSDDFLNDVAVMLSADTRPADAQAVLAEKDARIAELQSHIRTDNSETLVNALAEVERLRLNIAEYNEHERCWRSEIADLRTQLQAAPAERVVVLPERMETEAFTTIDKGSKNYKAGWNRALDEVARLNPAPATADTNNQQPANGEDYR